MALTSGHLLVIRVDLFILNQIFRNIARLFSE